MANSIKNAQSNQGADSGANYAGVSEYVNNLGRYGVTPQERPQIKPTKSLDLSDFNGRAIVESATTTALRTHKNTFKKLADM